MANPKPTNHDKWKSIIAEQEASGLSQTAFCKQQGISLAKFGYYRGILKPKLKQSPSIFQPVQIKEKQQTTNEIRLSLPNGLHVTCPPDIAACQMKEWVKALLSC